MRAFRPSRFAHYDDGNEEREDPDRLRNVTRYQQRAEAGLPLFESSVFVMETNVQAAASGLSNSR